MPHRTIFVTRLSLALLKEIDRFQMRIVKNIGHAVIFHRRDIVGIEKFDPFVGRLGRARFLDRGV